MDEKLIQLLKNSPESMLNSLGIEFVELFPDRVVATMPVDSRTKQPFGLLHGGASVAFAETLASAGAWLNIDVKKYAAVGMEINANHLRGVSGGILTGKAKPIHRGRKTQVWDIRIYTEEKKLVCIARCTVAVVPQSDSGCCFPKG